MNLDRATLRGQEPRDGLLRGVEHVCRVDARRGFDKMLAPGGASRPPVIGSQAPPEAEAERWSRREVDLYRLSFDGDSPTRLTPTDGASVVPLAWLNDDQLLHAGGEIWDTIAATRATGDGPTPTRTVLRVPDADTERVDEVELR